MSAQAATLPEAFADLQPFVEQWAVATMAERMQRRFNSTAQERQRFYGAMAARSEAAAEFLNQFDLATDGFPPEARRLFQLLLSLAEVSLTEEVNGQEVEAVHANSNRLIAVIREIDGR